MKSTKRTPKGTLMKTVRIERNATDLLENLVLDEAAW